MSLTEDYRAVKNRLRNPANGRVSDEIEVVSHAEWKRRKIAADIRDYEQSRAERDNARWDAMMVRLRIEADSEAVKRANREREDLENGTLTMETVMRVACGYFAVTRLDMISHRRTARVTYPRHMAMYLSRKHTTFSLPQIGNKFGGRDHTTVLHAIEKIEALIAANDAKICSDVARLRRVLGVECPTSTV